jgi:hypothetical protein
MIYELPGMTIQGITKAEQPINRKAAFPGFEQADLLVRRATLRGEHFERPPTGLAHDLDSVLQIHAEMYP